MFRSIVNGSRRCFSTTRCVRAFDLALEQDIRRKIDALPSVNKLFQNADGSPRTPNDEELKTIGELNVLADKRNLSFSEYFTLSEENSELYIDNYTDLESFQSSSKKILDKIPYEDSKTGEIKWKVVRENEEEGWEKLIYYFFVPAVFLMGGVALFKKDKPISEWALDELRLRVQEEELGDRAVESLKNEGKSSQEIDERDNVIIERIISGEYDKLAGLKLKAPALPIVEGEI